MNAVKTSANLTPEQAQLLRLPFLYKDFGWCLTRVRTRTKAPVDVGWQNAPPPSDEQLLDWFGDGEFGPGLRLGAVSGDIYDLECDDEAIIPFVEWFAPPWSKECPRWARSGRPHVLVRADGHLSNLRFTLGGSCVLELRGDGEQSVLPPAIHPSGERYAWIGEPHQPPLTSSTDILEWLQNSVVAFALRHGWNEGSRHDQALAASGWMCRLGLAVERALRIIECVAQGDGREAGDRAKGVRDTYAAIALGEPASGWPTLERLVPVETARLLRQVWPRRQDDDEERNGPYVVRNGSTFWRKPAGDGTWKDVLLANFDLRIGREIRRDDGSDVVPTLFEVSGHNARGRLPVVRVATSEFSGMQWVVPSFGTEAIISAGQGLKDREREAIQRFSGEPLKRTVYTHSGWRQINGVWAFLHGGLSGDVEVDLEGTLAGYRLPPVAADPQTAIERSLKLLELGDAPVLTALWCATFLAPVASILKPDFTVWMWGPTGSLKSSLAALFLSHFGAFERKNLPADWSSTDNSLERLAFLAKDVPLVIDEFAPPPGRIEQQRMVAKASRVLRAQGNIAGRGRLRADTSARATLHPRGLLISTAEVPPPLPASAVSRTLAIDLKTGAIDEELLSEAQHRAGDLSVAMAAFIHQLEQRYDELCATLPAAFAVARAAQQKRGHRRIPEVLANLEVAASLALNVFRELGGLSPERVASLMHDIQRELTVLGDAQDRSVREQNPARRFLSVLSEVLAKKAAFLNGRRGNEPPDCEQLGWHVQEVQAGDNLGDTCYSPARGAVKIGWADEDHLYLLPQETFRTATRFLGDSDQSLGATEASLHRALEDLGVIEVRHLKGETRRTLPITLEGSQHRVLKLRRSALVTERLE